MAAMGLNNADLAKAAKVKPPTSFNWASGKTKNIKGEPLLRAAVALGVGAQWLATGTGAKFPEQVGNLVQSPAGAYVVTPQYDPHTREAIRIMLGLQDYQREGALAALRSHVQNLTPPSDGHALPMAA